MDLTGFFNLGVVLDLRNEILIEVMENGIMPIRAHNDDGGFDLFFPNVVSIPPMNDRYSKLDKIGMKVKILLPLGWTGFIRPRSSAYLNRLDVNGTIDRYTGEIHLTVHNEATCTFVADRGHAIAQLIPVFTGAGLCKDDLTIDDVLTLLTATNKIRQVDKLPETSRGDKGYGSTGNNMERKT